MKVIRTRRGARLEQDGLIVSEVLSQPGATDTLFDVLAATIAALSPGPRVAMLGFAAGGIIAPLRAMGFGHPIQACDLSIDQVPLFRELSEPWCGDVEVARSEAGAWLRRQRQPWDLIFEDLSARVDGEGTKPAVSLDVLPPRMAKRLAPGGLAITNVLPVPGRPWSELLPHLAAPFACAHVVHLDAWENRVLICAEDLPPARDVGDRLRRHLIVLGSHEAGGLSVRALKRPSPDGGSFVSQAS